MRNRKILKGAALVVIAAGISSCGSASRPPARVSQPRAEANHVDSHGHETAHSAKPLKPVPAYQSAEGAKNLNPTLPPERFQGQVRAAYAAVKAIPHTIAQLPCYCRCDRSVGHKSLHSCFEDDHGANCGICMNSALLAYKLEKEKKFTPEQIRDELNKQYAGY